MEENLIAGVEKFLPIMYEEGTGQGEKVLYNLHPIKKEFVKVVGL